MRITGVDAAAKHLFIISGLNKRMITLKIRIVLRLCVMTITLHWIFETSVLVSNYTNLGIIYSNYYHKAPLIIFQNTPAPE